MIVPLKQKYRTAGMAKKIGPGSNDSGKPRHRNRHPAPVVKQMLMVLDGGRKIRWEVLHDLRKG